MKITMINHSDMRGGAAMAAVRLMNALCAAGADVRMLVMHKETDSLRIEEVEPAWRRKACFLWEHLDIFLHNGMSRSKLFQASIANCGMPLSQHPWVKSADVVVLHWVNQGMLSLKKIGRIQAPVAWVMHDMWNLTGICHHAGSCNRYQTTCGACQLLTGGLDKPMRKDLSTTTQARKASLYRQKPITFIPVSTWLEEKCRQSSLMEGMTIEKIPLAFPIDNYSTCPTTTRSECGLHSRRRLIAMGAARLDDPVKGLPVAIDAFNLLSEKEIGKDLAVVFFGALKDKHALDTLKLPYIWLGPVADQTKLRQIYTHCEVVLSASSYESFGLTLLEGMASGCRPVTFGNGGQGDIVDHLDTGYIAEWNSSSDLAAGIEWALSQPHERQRLHDVCKERFCMDAVAQHYLKLFKSMTKQ